MLTTRSCAAILAALTLAQAGCGSSGSSGGTISRPIETSIYVAGGQGLQFMFAETADPACGSSGTGIQAPNASHQFGSRVFQTPYLFVLENIRQPVRAVIQNLDATTPLQVSLFLGMNPQVEGSEGIIPPGECRTVITNRTLPLTPQPSGNQIQVDVCSPTDASGMPDLSISCDQSTVDRQIAFFATIGDIVATNITNCILGTVLDACRSPASFFLEQPKDQIAAIMNVNAGQNPGDPVPPARLRVDLNLNGRAQQSAFGTNPIVSAEL